jgi:hypothetical protein
MFIQIFAGLCLSHVKEVLQINLMQNHINQSCFICEGEIFSEVHPGILIQQIIVKEFYINENSFSILN